MLLRDTSFLFGITEKGNRTEYYKTKRGIVKLEWGVDSEEAGEFIFDNCAV